MLEIRRRMPKGCILVGQFHDAGLFECEVGVPAAAMKALIKEIFAEPVVVPTTGRSMVLSIDLKEGRRMSDVA
jgi:hypothetical protein